MDLKEGTLTVRQSRKVLPGENGYRRHQDPLRPGPGAPEVVEQALVNHLHRQRDQLRSAPTWEEHGLVFANEIGRPIDPSNLRRTVERLCKLAEIKPISPNEMRHTAGTLLVDSGMRLEDVADFLGHKDTSMLIETYRHRAKRVVNVTEGQRRMLGVA